MSVKSPALHLAMVMSELVTSSSVLYLQCNSGPPDPRPPPGLFLGHKEHEKGGGEYPSSVFQKSPPSPPGINEGSRV